MKLIKLVLFNTVLILGFGFEAFAGEGYFSRTYTTETMPAHQFEFEQIVRNRNGRAFGSYSAFDFRTEIEYGVSDQFQAAFYFNTGAINASGAPDDDDASGTTGFSRKMLYLQGFSTEFIYRVLSPFSDPIGLALYFEPEVQFHDIHNGLEYDFSFSNEFKIILQKNFFDDQLVIAYNMTAEIEFIRYQGEASWSGELDWNHELAGAYRFTSNWYGGLEFRNHNEIGNFKTHEHSVLWGGPNLHYGAKSFWATLGVLRQLYGSPNGVDSNGTFIGNSLFLRSHEAWEITAKVGFPF